MDTTTDLNVEAPQGLSRRTMVRTALWSAPVVSMAAAAPAFAASGNPDGWGTLAVASGEWRLQGVERWLEVGKELDLGIRIKTTRVSALIPARGLTVTVTFPYQLVSSDFNNIDRTLVVKRVSTNWEAGAPQYFGTGTQRRATVRFTYLAQLRPGTGLTDGTSPLSFDVQRDTTTQHLAWRDVKTLPFTFQTARISTVGAGVVAVRT